ncbi:MAG TPA: KTSC domain-containing protein [Rhizomicrobium sp.]|nr:KTSC domain-containing protein [Rhizomicrobium sp.]
MTTSFLTSKTLAAAVYDASQARLQLDFRDGSRYVYSPVPPHLFRALLAADSKGRFFNQHIRRVLPYSKVVPGM